MRMLSVPITELDLDMFKEILLDNSNFEWIFQDSDGRDVCITFMTQEEFNNESKDDKS